MQGASSPTKNQMTINLYAVEEEKSCDSNGIQLNGFEEDIDPNETLPGKELMPNSLEMDSFDVVPDGGESPDRGMSRTEIQNGLS